MNDQQLKMEYGSEYDNRTNICTVRVYRTLESPKDAYTLRFATLDLAEQLNCSKFLFDLTRAQIVTKTLAAFEIANPKGEITATLRNLAGAIYYKKITAHEIFFETIAVNRGFRIKVFDEYDKAIFWLSSLSL